jgi:hypothetical protein
MKNESNLIAKAALACLAFSFISIKIYAQKELKVQEASIRAPDKVKIDGKSDEWGTLQAHNTVDRIFYTVANDDKNLYVVIRTQGPFVNDKMCNGGFTFTVSHSVDKRKREKAADNVSVTYPVVDKERVKKVNNASDVYFYNWSGNRRAGNEKHIDSLQAVINEYSDAAFKEIRVTGIKDVDTLISIYNTDGIKAIGHFDNTLLFNCEIAIPLKYLGLDANDGTKFSYNIKMSGVAKRATPVVVNLRRSGPGSIDALPPPMAPIITDPNLLYIIDPHDFWAEYTLAKK